MLAILLTAIIIIVTVSMLLCISMCMVASDADERMEELFRRKYEKENKDGK